MKSNVISGEAELNAEIALEEEGKAMDSPEPVPVNPNPDSNRDDVQPPKKDITSYLEFGSEWTIERVKGSLSPELIAFYEKTYREERLELFYGGIAGVLNCLRGKKEGLKPAKVSKMLCGFWLTDKGVIGRISRIFGILPSGRFPISLIVDRDGELIKKLQALPRIFVRITKEEAEQLEREHNGCEYYGVEEGQSADYVYYDIPENMWELLPVLEFAYNKHLGN